MSAITAKASRKMKKYAVLTREPRCFLGSFDFSWEQRKVSDLAEKTYGGGTPTTSNEAYWNGDIPWIQSSDVVDGKLLGVEPRKWITQDGLNNSAAQLIPGNSIAIITRVGVGKLAFMPYSYATSQDFLSLSKLNAEPLFTVYACYKKLQSELNAVQGTSIKGITKDELLAKNIMVPRYAEQQQIGAFFKQLDNLITLHQRKCVFLFGFFQAFISMIFTASTFSWEQRKLGELVDRVVRKNINNESTLPLTISAQYGLVDQITYFNNRVASRDVSNYYLVLNGEFAYNKSTSDGYPFGAVKRLDLYEKGVLSTLYIVFAPKKEQQIDSDYLTVFFDTDRWHKGVAERAAEGARNHGLLNISAEDFFDIDLSVPKDIVEQKQIGAFIRQLDNLITLHQRECISFTARAGRLILTANKKRNTSSWEQRKVQDVADRFDNLRIPVAANLRVHGTTPYYGANGIQDYVEGFTHDGEFVLVAEDGANDLKNYPVKCVNGRIWVNNHAHILQGKAGIADNSFLAFAISQSDIESLLVGGGRAKLNAETLMSIEFRLSCLQEQYRIGEYLTQLDHLITLHQRKPFLMKWRTSDANRNQTNRLVL